MNIVIENLQFSYGFKQVLNMRYAKFEQGKIYGIVGKNGAGKTTFFKALTNIITNYSGQVRIDGVAVKDDVKVLSKVGIVLDDMELYKNHTALFNLRYFGGLRGGFNEEQALKYIEELELTPVLHKKISSYSLGMNKKLILLIALINDAEILIFDEPFRGLDAKSVQWFKNHFLDLRNKGRMILISSHVQDDIESMCDEVKIIAEGDFHSSFDLNDMTQTYIYKVEVNNSEVFCALLQARNIAFEKLEKFIKFELDEAQYKELFKEAVNNDIEFYQIKKASKFVDFIQ
ncbi:MAG: ABC transporter ATP-binding protein [Bacteroidales bacterium]|jgi:ABC-2 type transport system ATP-binding protein|nr:ABC transporter ATP-binding protein [Bacteroidales bacterium]